MGTFWNPLVELSRTATAIAKRGTERRVFVFLRELRHRLFDEELQTKLASG